MNDINEMPPKCQYCSYWEVCEYPWVCPDIGDNKPDLQPTCNKLATDAISRRGVSAYLDNMGYPGLADVVMDENRFPSVQPDEEKISDTLYSIYRNTSPHTSAEGVVAIKYYIREIYREIFGKEKPGWMR